MENSESVSRVAGLCSMMSEVSAGGHEGRGWSHLQAPFLTCHWGMLVVGWEPSWGCQLEHLCVASWLPHDMVAGSEGSVAREGAQWKLYHCLWISFGNHTVSLPPHSIGKVVTELCQGRRTQMPLLMEECWYHTERRACGWDACWRGHLWKIQSAHLLRWSLIFQKHWGVRYNYLYSRKRQTEIRRYNVTSLGHFI